MATQNGLKAESTQGKPVFGTTQSRRGGRHSNFRMGHTECCREIIKLISTQGHMKTGDMSFGKAGKHQNKIL